MVENKIEKILKKIKNLVCIERKYKITRHVERDYIDQHLCSYQDIEHCIQNANNINYIQPDEYNESVDGKKYTILGKSVEGQEFYTTGKFMLSEDRSDFYLIITAHKLIKETK